MPIDHVLLIFPIFHDTGAYGRRHPLSPLINLSLRHAVDKDEKTVGSYGPNEEPYEWTAKPMMSVPSGMLARATYNQGVRLTDDDGKVWLDLTTKFTIAKEW